MRGTKFDRIFLGIVGALLAAGVFTLASASLGLLLEEGGGVTRVVARQALSGIGVGGVLFLLTSRMRYQRWRTVALPFFLFALALSFLVFVPGIGFGASGARRWIAAGPLFFQPTELLKFAFVVYLSSWLAGRQREVGRFREGFLPFVLLLALVGVVFVLQPDIGTFGALAATAVFLFYIGGGRLRHLLLLLPIVLLALGALALTEPYRLSRVATFLHLAEDPQGAGYHIRQALIAIGSGGFWGRGFGMGRQKFNYLPEPTGDSIFAVLGEEFGFMGSVLLVAALSAFALRGFVISRRAPDSFGRLLGSGIVILIIIQSFINIAAMIGLVPLTGLPLIFISQGGSALAVALAEVGVVANISRQRA